MSVSYAQRQQWRRLKKAASRGTGAAVALLAAVLAARANQPALAILLLLLSGVMALASCQALRLARRSQAGAASEARVRRALKPLTREGWRVGHALDWPGRGDLDHVVRSPSGMGFVIETKTLRFSHAHLARTIDAARSLARRRRHYPRGVVPVVCVARARSLERLVGNLLSVSLDRLLPALRAAAAVETVARRSTGGRPERSASRPGVPETDLTPLA